MMKLALFTVTYCGLWYRGRALTLEEQMEKARNLGFEGISIETKRPVALPCDLDKNRRRRIREVADLNNIAIAAVETMSNFVSPITEERENNLCMVKEALELAYDLDVDIVKVFAAWPGTSRYNGLGTYEAGQRINEFKRYFTTSDQMWRWAVEGIKDAAEWAEDYGITIALQNHPPVLGFGYEDALQMVKEIGMDNVKLCLDVPFFTDQSDEYVHEAVEACREVGIVLTHYSSLHFDENPEGKIIMRRAKHLGKIYVNYPSFVRELSRINYDGFLVSEECAPVLENHEYQSMEAVDRHVKAALKYMEDLIAKGKEPQIIKC